MRYILTGAAVIALAAGGAYADPGKGKGNDKHAAAQTHGKAQGKAQTRGPGPGAKAKANVRAKAHVAQNGQGNKHANQGNSHKPQARQVERRQEPRAVSRGNGNRDRKVENRVDRREVRRDDRRGSNRYVDRDRYEEDRRFLAQDRSRGLIDGCPPGLAKKHNGCMPPGQAKARDGYYDRSLFGYDYRPRLFGLTNYSGGNYYYNDGYLLRMGDAGRISGYIPLLGGALSIGNPWPQQYSYNQMPNYYVDYYNLGPSANYRYADNVIYRVDPQDAAITSIAALLTGNDFNVGQPMPRGYDVYNVPYAYQDRYYDTPDSMYRYSDGYVYRIDPKTQLVAAAINLLL